MLHIELLRRSVGNPRHGVDLHRSVGCLAVARPRGKNGTPRVRHVVATLHRGEDLRRNIATVHHEQILDFVSKHLVFVHRQFKDPCK